MLMTYTGSSPGRVSFPHLTGPEGRDGEADATEAGATMVSASSAVDRVPAATMDFFTMFSLPVRELHADAQPSWSLFAPYVNGGVGPPDVSCRR